MSSRPPGPGGVFTHTTSAGSWAWIGLRLAPADTLREHRGYADLPEEQRRAEAAAAELAWLRAQCLPDPNSRFELRYSSRGGRLHGVLLGLAAAATREDAIGSALALGSRLAALPGHVRGVPIDDAAEVQAELDALGVDGRPPAMVDLREIRKRVTTWPISRVESSRRWAVTSSRFAPSVLSWEQVWAELARQEGPTVLSVCLEPVLLPAGTDRVLWQFAGEYGRLAEAGAGSPVWGGVRPVDRGAQAGRDHFADALRRYCVPCYRIRVTLAAAGPVPPGLAERVADQLASAPGDPATGAAVLTPAPDEWATAWHNLTLLGLEKLPVTSRQGIDPSLWTEVDETLAELADPQEAAAAFRLPYEIAGHLPLFHRPPSQPVPSAREAVPGRGETAPGRPAI